MWVSGVWIGLNDRDSEGNFEWLGTGEPLGEWNNWREDHPRSTPEGDDYDCVVMGAGRRQWKNVDCVTGIAYYPLCEHVPLPKHDGP